MEASIEELATLFMDLQVLLEVTFTIDDRLNKNKLMSLKPRWITLRLILKMVEEKLREPFLLENLPEKRCGISVVYALFY